MSSTPITSSQGNHQSSGRFNPANQEDEKEYEIVDRDVPFENNLQDLQLERLQAKLWSCDSSTRQRTKQTVDGKVKEVFSRKTPEIMASFLGSMAVGLPTLGAWSLPLWYAGYRRWAGPTERSIREDLLRKELRQPARLLDQNPLQLAANRLIYQGKIPKNLDEATQNYRKLLLAYHPDKNKNAQFATDKTAEITDARDQFKTLWEQGYRL